MSWAQEDIPDAPNPPRMVTDLAGVLSKTQQDDLEQLVRRYRDTSSTEIAIVLIPTYGKYDRADYTFRLANKWKIGQQGKNNGLLITAAINDRKYFIATGYGLEGSVPDVIAYEVGTQYLKPNFKEGNYYEGLRAATEYLAKLPADEFKADKKAKGGGGWIIFLVILFILFFIVLPMIRNKGGGGGGHYRKGGYTPPFIVFGSGGSSSGWGGSGSSDWGGGGSDFGGFGGGSFGGGGAGGDW